MHFLGTIFVPLILISAQTAAIWNKDEFEALENNASRLMEAINSPPSKDDRRLSGVRDHLKHIVVGSVRVKAEVVSADEREGGLRNLLNFGRSFFYAILRSMPNKL